MLLLRASHLLRDLHAERSERGEVLPAPERIAFPAFDLRALLGDALEVERRVASRGRAMNRHERRKMFALGMRAAKTGEFPEHYIRVIRTIAQTYIRGLSVYPAGAELPRFRLGPKEIMVIASIEAFVDRLAANKGARVFLESIVESAQKMGDPKAMPTVFMLRCGLEMAGANIEYVSAADWGLTVGGKDN